MKKLLSLFILSATLQANSSNCQQTTEFYSDVQEVSDDTSPRDDHLFLSSRPMVKASASVVEIDDFSIPNEYFGNLYVGSEMWGAKVCYDTLSDWTVVSKGFDTYQSGTNKPVYDEDGRQTIASVEFGQPIQGQVYEDSMCLISNGGPQSLLSSRLCVKGNKFIRGDILSDDNTYQGILGLGRGTMKRPSYPKLLHLQGQILEPVVSFNYEDPDDHQQVSKIAFGEILYSEIEGGKAETNFYSNLGRDQWGILIDDFYYDDQDMTNNQGPKIALIDTGNVSIQLPQYVWENVLVQMEHASMHQGYHVKSAVAENGLKEIRIDNKNCRDIWDKLKPIQFKIEQTQILINPRGYTYQLDQNQGYCQIGFQSIPGESNEYKLGTIFLRNFYTSLDYDRDLIAIGVNKAAADNNKAFIIGHRSNPYEDNGLGGPTALTYLLVVLLAVMCAGVTVFIASVIIQKRKRAQLRQQQESDDEDGDGEEGSLTDDDLMVTEEGDEEEQNTSPEDKKDQKRRASVNKDEKQTNYLIQSESFDQDDEDEHNQEQMVSQVIEKSTIQKSVDPKEEDNVLEKQGEKKVDAEKDGNDDNEEEEDEGEEEEEEDEEDSGDKKKSDDAKE